MADRISVIVPVYNVAADLPRCLDSILAQTYPYIEIIAVDDGSPDDSGKILDHYAGNYPNIRVIHKENGGVTSARLRGIEEASGEWIGFVDGDDEIEPDMYDRLMANAVKHGADISHCGYKMLFPDGRVNCFYNTGRLIQQDHATAIKDLLDGTFVEPGLWNKLFRRELFCRVLRDNVMDTSIKINEDLLMNYYLFSQAESAVFEDLCPYHYIVRQDSASRQKLNTHKIYDPIKVKAQILEHVPDELKEQARQAYLRTCISAYNNIIMSEEKVFETDRRNVRRMIIENRFFVPLLTRKQRIQVAIIRFVPWLYKPLYRFYATYILKNPYV